MTSERLSLADVKQLLLQKHGQPLQDDDPILMVATMLESYLNDLEEILGRHEAVLQEVLSTETAEYIREVKSMTEDLLERAVRANMQYTVQEIMAHQTAMNKFLDVLRKFTLIQVTCLLLTITIAMATFFSWVH